MAEASDYEIDYERRKEVSELSEQIAVFNWAEFAKHKYPQLKFLFAIPNGGSRHIAEAVNLKKSGTKSGVPDMCLPVKRGEYGALYIEMKSDKGKVSPFQSDWLKYLNENGYKAVVCRSSGEAIDTITKYLKGLEL